LDNPIDHRFSAIGDINYDRRERETTRSQICSPAHISSTRCSRQDGRRHFPSPHVHHCHALWPRHDRYHFGNFQGAQISGNVFEDVNGDTVKEGGEPGLAAWRVRLSGTKTDSTLTDGSGNYSFTNLIAGNYTVTEALQAGWHESRPASGSYSISISGGNQVTGKEFRQLQIWKHRRIEIQRPKHERHQGWRGAGIANWVLHLTGPVTISAVTDLNGNYSFVNLVRASYSVSESLRTDWYQTLPPGNGSYAITLRSGLDTSGLLFGNHYAPR